MKFFFSFLFFISTLFAQSILENSSYVLDNENRSFETIVNSAKFTDFSNNYSNFGVISDQILWVKIPLENSSDELVQRYLEIVDLYPNSVQLFNSDGELLDSYILSPDKTLSTLNLAYSLILPAQSKDVYYMRVENRKTMMRFGLNLYSASVFIDNSVKKIMEITFLFGIIVALMLYNLMIYFHTKASMYLFYVLYIGSVSLQQLSYLSILPMLCSQDIVDLFHSSSVFQISLMYLSASLYSRSFLRTYVYVKIDRIYKFFIILAIIEVPLIGTSWLYIPDIALLTGLAFVFFNTFSGIYIYLDGNKQARLFSLAWSMLVFAYTVIILDSLSVISVMHNIPNLIMYFTAVEALILSLAFSDRYSLLQQEKEQSDKRLLDTLEEQAAIVGQEVKLKTEDLNSALENKKILLKELHHRTKNNLQLILSLIRMQASRMDNDEIREEFFNLEGRIAAISRTHEILYLKDDFESIEMKEYITVLCEQLQEGVAEVLEFDLKISYVVIPLRESVYIGLIINELMTNSVKYAQSFGNTKITIKMRSKNNRYFLELCDNGHGNVEDIASSNSLGLTLVNTLVKEQLEGTIEVYFDQGICYKIEFTL